MKTKFLLIVCLLALFAGAVSAQTPGPPKPVSWQQYTVSDGKFSVDLPAPPVLHLSTRFREGFEMGRQVIQLGSYVDGVVYTVLVLENPNPKQVLQDFIADQTASGYVLNVSSERKVSQAGLSGKTFLYADFRDGVAQFFISDDRLYDFRTLGAAPDDPRVTRFFSSISFAKAKNAIEVKEGPENPVAPVVQEERPEAQLPYGAYLGRDVTSKARLGMKPEPNYTESARENGINGTVVLKVIFRYDGSVVNIRTVSGLPYGLTERAIAAARKIKFIPATKDGKYVSMWMQLEYNFALY